MKKKLKEKPVVRLEEWEMYPFYTLTGKVYDHPRFKDGDKIVTSRIHVADFPNNKIETINTIYTLGSKKEI